MSYSGLRAFADDVDADAFVSGHAHSFDTEPDVAVQSMYEHSGRIDDAGCGLSVARGTHDHEEVVRGTEPSNYSIRAGRDAAVAVFTIIAILVVPMRIEERDAHLLADRGSNVDLERVEGHADAAGAAPHGRVLILPSGNEDIGVTRPYRQDEEKAETDYETHSEKPPFQY